MVLATSSRWENLTLYKFLTLFLHREALSSRKHRPKYTEISEQDKKIHRIDSTQEFRGNPNKGK